MGFNSLPFSPSICKVFDTPNLPEAEAISFIRLFHAVTLLADANFSYNVYL
jgi:hypothetical protein